MNEARPGYQCVAVPIGWVGIVTGPQGITEVLLTTTEEQLRGAIQGKYPGIQPIDEGLAGVGCTQVREYFEGRRTYFDLPLDWSQCGAFAARVLRELVHVPFGGTLTYGELADRAGYPGRARGVGQVMARNPFPLIVPCHRVLGRGGRLTGYSGGDGLATKRWLLDFEQSKE